MRPLARNACVVMAGLVACAAIAGCGGSTAGLIPSGYSMPLQHDFETVLETARTGDGACASTETALNHTRRDFEDLPPSVDAALRTRIMQGISYLTAEALRECSTVKTTTTTTTTKSKTKASTEVSTIPVTTSATVETVVSTVTSASATTPENGGGTPAETGGSNPGGSEASGEQPPAGGAQPKEPGT
jgi:hypothetical protein